MCRKKDLNVYVCVDMSDMRGGGGYSFSDKLCVYVPMRGLFSHLNQI